jgi:hypothetical protein
MQIQVRSVSDMYCDWAKSEEYDRKNGLVTMSISKGSWSGMKVFEYASAVQFVVSQGFTHEEAVEYINSMEIV